MLKFEFLSKYKIFYYCIITVLPILFSTSIIGKAQAEYLRPSDLNNFKVSCYLEHQVPLFCSKKTIENPDIILSLPVFKSVNLNQTVHAFRLMASIENHTKRNIIGAKVRLFIGGVAKSRIDFIIDELIIYRDKSSTKKTHLIRSDIPRNKSIYHELHHAYYAADLSQLELELTELHFE